MKLKGKLPIFIVIISILICNLCYAKELENNLSQEEFMLSEEYQLMEQQRKEIEQNEQKILDDIENNPIITFSATQINPMGLPDIDPITNPAEDNWLTQEIAKRVGKNNVSQLTQADFNKIRTINMDSSDIKEIPKQIGNLTNLMGLSLSNNELSQLPTEIGNLTKLYYLNLGEQNITLPNKSIEQNEEFSIINPISVFNTPITPANISNNGLYNNDSNSISWMSSDIDREETFSFSQSVTIGGKTSTFSGTVKQPTTIGKEEPISITFSDNTVNSHVYTEQTLSIPIIIKGSDDYYAMDTTIDYDSSKLKFEGYSIKKGFKDYYVSSKDNSLRYIIASQGKENPINSSVTDIVYLNFTALESGSATIHITKGQLANLDKEIDVTNLGSATIVIEDKILPPATPKDINKDGKFTLIDLAIDAYYYGISADETDKTKYDADIILDGKIDDEDLQEIVNQILNN